MLSHIQNVKKCLEGFQVMFKLKTNIRLDYGSFWNPNKGILTQKKMWRTWSLSWKDLFSREGWFAICSLGCSWVDSCSCNFRRWKFVQLYLACCSLDAWWGDFVRKYGSQNHRIGTRYPIFRMPGQHTRNSSSLVEIFSQERLVHI